MNKKLKRKFRKQVVGLDEVIGDWRCSTADLGEHIQRYLEDGYIYFEYADHFSDAGPQLFKYIPETDEQYKVRTEEYKMELKHLNDYIAAFHAKHEYDEEDC